MTSSSGKKVDLPTLPRHTIGTPAGTSMMMIVEVLLRKSIENHKKSQHIPPYKLDWSESKKKSVPVYITQRGEPSLPTATSLHIIPNDDDDGEEPIVVVVTPQNEEDCDVYPSWL